MNERKIETDNNLTKRVIEILLDYAEDYDNTESYIHDMTSGCATGVIGELIYYTDTVAWFRKYKEEIKNLIKETELNYGANIQDLLKDYDKEDIFCEEEHNQNLLAWFSFEQITNELLTHFEAFGD